jgi:hypothetical protein
MREFFDLLDANSIAAVRFEDFAIARLILTRSTARLGFGLCLSTSSKAPYVQFHCAKRVAWGTFTEPASRGMSVLLSPQIFAGLQFRNVEISGGT